MRNKMQKIIFKSLCSLPYALCPLHHALCALHYALCPMRYETLSNLIVRTPIPAPAILQI